MPVGPRCCALPPRRFKHMKFSRSSLSSLPRWSVAGVLSVLALASAWAQDTSPAASAAQDQPALVARGKQLALAADCVACHQRPYQASARASPRPPSTRWA